MSKDNLMSSQNDPPSFYSSPSLPHGCISYRCHSWNRSNSLKTFYILVKQSVCRFYKISDIQFLHIPKHARLALRKAQTLDHRTRKRWSVCCSYPTICLSWVGAWSTTFGFRQPSTLCKFLESNNWFFHLFMFILHDFYHNVAHILHRYLLIKKSCQRGLPQDIFYKQTNSLYFLWSLQTSA